MQCWLGNVFFQYFQKSNSLVNNLCYFSCRNSGEFTQHSCKWIKTCKMSRSFTGAKSNGGAYDSKGPARAKYLERAWHVQRPVFITEIFIGSLLHVPSLSALIILAMLFKVDVLVRLPCKIIPETNSWVKIVCWESDRPKQPGWTRESGTAREVKASQVCIV